MAQYPAWGQARKGTVQAQSLPVYEEMSKDSDVVATLQHGAEIVVLFSAMTGDGSWCSVGNPGSTVRVGYVECSGLNIEAAAASSGLAPDVGTSGPPPTQEQKAWALAASAIAATVNREGTSTLAAGTPAHARLILARGWLVHSQNDIFGVFDMLDQGVEREAFAKLGRRTSAMSDAQFSQLLSRATPMQANADKVAREYYPRYQFQTLMAWEYVRYINVCRWGVAAGYLTPDEAWPRVMYAAHVLQRTFGSWQEMADDYMVGRKFVPPKDYGTPPETEEEAVRWLSRDQASPWRRIPWGLPLN